MPNLPGGLFTGVLLWVALPAWGQSIGKSTSTLIRVQVDSVQLLNEFGQRRPVRPVGEIRLLPRQNYLSLTLRAEPATSVLYRLDGLDEEWFRGFSTDRLHYTNLTGGHYVFRVRAAGGGPETQLAITLESPFWQSWWFLPLVVLYVLGVIGIVLYLFLQYRFRQRLRFYQARDRIARDLHDDMGSYLSSISILSQTAHRSATRDPAKTQATLTRIGQTARQIMDSMGDIVWSINPDHDSMAHVIDRMSDVAADLFANDEVAWQMDVPDEVRRMSLSTECRRDFFLIYKESITNAARYAGADHIRIVLRREPGWLRLTVQDNGSGFDPQCPARQNPSGGNGLRNMKTRASLLNGTLTIESEPGQGTTISLRFPA